MGTTIFYNIYAKDEGNVNKIISKAVSSSRALEKVRLKKVAGYGDIVIPRGRDIIGFPPTQTVMYKKGKVKYKGVVIKTGTTDDINLIFVKQDYGWIAKSFVKTQPFSPEEFENNLFIHMWLVALFRELVEQRLAIVEVHDESGFYKTGDLKKLEKSYGSVLKNMSDVLDRMEVPNTEKYERLRKYFSSFKFKV